MKVYNKKIVPQFETEQLSHIVCDKCFAVFNADGCQKFTARVNISQNDEEQSEIWEYDFCEDCAKNIFEIMQKIAPINSTVFKWADWSL